MLADYEAKIAALESKVGQRTLENELLKKARRLRLVSNAGNSSIVVGSRAGPECQVVPRDAAMRLVGRPPRDILPSQQRKRLHHL